MMSDYFWLIFFYKDNVSLKNFCILQFFLWKNSQQKTIIFSSYPFLQFRK